MVTASYRALCYVQLKLSQIKKLLRSFIFSLVILPLWLTENFVPGVWNQIRGKETTKGKCQQAMWSLSLLVMADGILVKTIHKKIHATCCNRRSDQMEIGYFGSFISNLCCFMWPWMSLDISSAFFSWEFTVSAKRSSKIEPSSFHCSNLFHKTFWSAAPLPLYCLSKPPVHIKTFHKKSRYKMKNNQKIYFSKFVATFDAQKPLLDWFGDKLKHEYRISQKKFRDALKATTVFLKLGKVHLRPEQLLKPLKNNRKPSDNWRGRDNPKQAVLSPLKYVTCFGLGQKDKTLAKPFHKSRTLEGSILGIRQAENVSACSNLVHIILRSDLGPRGLQLRPWNVLQGIKHVMVLDNIPLTHWWRGHKLGCLRGHHQPPQSPVAIKMRNKEEYSPHLCTCPTMKQEKEFPMRPQHGERKTDPRSGGPIRFQVSNIHYYILSLYEYFKPQPLSVAPFASIIQWTLFIFFLYFISNYIIRVDKYIVHSRFSFQVLTNHNSRVHDSALTNQHTWFSLHILTNQHTWFSLHILTNHNSWFNLTPGNNASVERASLPSQHFHHPLEITHPQRSPWEITHSGNNPIRESTSIHHPLRESTTSLHYHHKTPLNYGVISIRHSIKAFHTFITETKKYFHSHISFNYSYPLLSQIINSHFSTAKKLL
ncbi:hypothetical protein VP01_1744g3 [Puccinia sorghi]|uniref:Uncharacterized protein n=1 Tax=Puccinia sorghi TaxID=27349 RepID=A0A0L6VF72_9BASI|nr:hypothetical protein VP01_1744g3 [Puccinia sorghi]